MDEARDFSLYNRIIKSENNSAVIQNILLVDVCPHLVKLIKIFAYDENKKWLDPQEQLNLWEKNKIYLEDIKNLNGKTDYNGNNVLTNEKLEKFAGGKSITELIKPNIAKDKTDWLPFDYGDIDVAGICKILRKRINDDIRQNKPFQEFLGSEKGLGFYRNEYGGHLTENLRKSCSLDDVKNAITNIKKPLDTLINQMRTAQLCNTPNRNQDALKVLGDISSFLKNMRLTINSICECKINKDNEKLYDAKNLYPYYIFLAYPSAENDKFRRFCNDVLRTDHAKSDKPIFTDQGTIDYLSALSISKSDERSHEAKKIYKELLEPMQREGILKVLRLTDEQHAVGYIDLEPINKTDIFIKKLQTVEGNICVITDNIDLADKIWEFNSNDEIKNCSAVAMRIYNKEKAVPFYK